MSTGTAPVIVRPRESHTNEASYLVFDSKKKGIENDLAQYEAQLMKASDDTITKKEVGTFTEAVRHDYERAANQNDIHWHVSDEYAEKLSHSMSNTKLGLDALERIKHAWVSLIKLESANPDFV